MPRYNQPDVLVCNLPISNTHGSELFSNDQPIFKSSILFHTLPLQICSSCSIMCEKVWESESSGTDLDSAWREFQGELTLWCKNMEWPVLSEGGQTPLFHFSKVAQFASATTVRLMQEDCSIMRGEWGFIPLIKSKEAGSDPPGDEILLCCCKFHLGPPAEVSRIQTRRAVKAGLFLLLLQTWIVSRAWRLILDSNPKQLNDVKSNGEHIWLLEDKHISCITQFIKEIVFFVLWENFFFLKWNPPGNCQVVILIYMPNVFSPFSHKCLWGSNPCPQYPHPSNLK